jgi:hypothetical protein
MIEQEQWAVTISLAIADVDGTLITEDKVLAQRAHGSIKVLTDALMEAAAGAPTTLLVARV